MDKIKIRERVRDAWAERYPRDKPARIDGIVDRVLGGALISVHSIDENKKEEDSVVYINRYYEVQIFETTPELIAFLQSRSRLVVVDTISDPSFITGLVFLILIAVVFYVGLRDDHFNREALSALTSVLGVAAGFYFGTKRQA